MKVWGQVLDAVEGKIGRCRLGAVAAAVCALAASVPAQQDLDSQTLSGFEYSRTSYT